MSQQPALEYLRHGQTPFFRLPAIDLAAPAPDFAGIATDLETAWRSPNVNMRCRQQLLRTLAPEVPARIRTSSRR